MRESLSTSDVEPLHRLEFWRSSITAMYAPLEIHDCEAASFGSNIIVTRLGSLVISAVSGVEQTVRRPRSLIRSGDHDDYVVALQRSGCCESRSNGRETLAKTGSITLYDLSLPSEMHARGRLDVIDISVPRATIERLVKPLRNAVGLSISVGPTSAPVVDFFCSLADAGHLIEGATARQIADIGVELLAGLFAERLALEPHMTSATLTYRAKAFIERHLPDYTLDVPAIAAALGVSERRLFKSFADEGSSINEFLWERRLTKAYQRLNDPAYQSVPVANVGCSVGFSSAAHFSRRFRTRFSMTPSECRDLGRLDRCSPSAGALLWLVALIVLSGTVAMHIFVPALLQAAAALSTSAESMQQTISVYILGLAGAQLVYGPFADRMGRRPVLLVGLVIFAFASFAAALASNIRILVFLRLLQALGGGAGLVIGRAIANDALRLWMLRGGLPP